MRHGEAGRGEGYRWWLKSHGHRPSISVIEKPASEENRNPPNTPFGFSRALARSPVQPGECAGSDDEGWGGMGL